MKLVRVDSESKFNNKLGTCAFDGNKGTWWHTRWKGVKPTLPHEIVLDLGRTRTVVGFCGLPRTDRGTGGMVKDFGREAGRSGSPASKGRFDPGRGEKEILFRKRKGRYVMLRGLTAHDGNPHMSIAEICILGR